MKQVDAAATGLDFHLKDPRRAAVWRLTDLAVFAFAP